MKGVFVEQVHPINPSQVEKLTYEWCKGLFGQQVTLCPRPSGSIAGNHYHRGVDASKNPERCIIVSGRGRLRTCNGIETQEWMLERPFTEVTIYPSILHAFVVEEDMLLIEYRATLFDSQYPDTYALETFFPYLENKKLPADIAALAAFQEHQENPLITCATK
ncbi:MAG TPA: hypothetical protein VJK03_01215 [Candidatus Nanoarchaeia archaeon]|nr:hypothetical protein [Candidatus Nanoarchaeia archaeon]